MSKSLTNIIALSSTPSRKMKLLSKKGYAFSAFCESSSDTHGKNYKGALPRLGQKGVGGASKGFPECKHQGRRKGPPKRASTPARGNVVRPITSQLPQYESMWFRVCSVAATEHTLNHIDSYCGSTFLPFAEVIAACTLPRLGQKGVGGASEGFPGGRHQGRHKGPPLEIASPPARGERVRRLSAARL